MRLRKLNLSLLYYIFFFLFLLEDNTIIAQDKIKVSFREEGMKMENIGFAFHKRVSQHSQVGRVDTSSFFTYYLYRCQLKRLLTKKMVFISLRLPAVAGFL